VPYPQGICLLCTLCSGLQMLFSISVAVPYFLYVLKTQPYANDGDDTYSTLLETVKIAQFSACLALSLQDAVSMVWRTYAVIALAYFLMWGVLGVAVLVALRTLMRDAWRRTVKAHEDTRMAVVLIRAPLWRRPGLLCRVGLRVPSVGTGAGAGTATRVSAALFAVVNPLRGSGPAVAVTASAASASGPPPPPAPATPR
jgi:hypothetical protein